jgi:hypothetical protein
MDEVHLTSQEVRDLVKSILEGTAFLDGETSTLRPSWVPEMRDWADLLLDRLEEGSN